MAEIWIKEAERLGDGSIGGAMDTPSAPARAVWHTTESGAGDAAFEAVDRYLRQIGAEPHILYDPTTDRLGQFGPLNESARALKNDGLTRTNRTGRACIQIEVLAKAATPFTGYWKPGANFRALMRAIRSWSVPDTWPGGALADRYGDPDVSRSRAVWAGKGGHYGHSQVPGNDHWDPGAINKAAIFAAAPKGSTTPTTPTTPTTVVTIDLSNVVAAAKRDPGLAQGKTTHAADVKVVEKALKAEGLLAAAYASDGSFGTSTVAAYKRWQVKCGYTGSAADGIPGKASLETLGARHGFKVKA